MLKKGLQYLHVVQKGVCFFGRLRQTFALAQNTSYFQKKKMNKLQQKQWKNARNVQRKLSFNRTRLGFKREIKWMGRIIPFCIKKFY